MKIGFEIGVVGHTKFCYIHRFTCFMSFFQPHCNSFVSSGQKPSDTSPRDSSGLPDECQNGKGSSSNVSEAIKEIKQAIQMSKNVQLKSTSSSNCDGPNQPVWVPRYGSSMASSSSAPSPSTSTTSYTRFISFCFPLFALVLFQTLLVTFLIILFLSFYDLCLFCMFLMDDSFSFIFA